MSARCWTAIIIATFLVPTAHAAAESMPRISDAVFASTQDYKAAVPGVASSSVPVNSYGIRAASALHRWRILFLDSNRCGSGNCYQLRATAFSNTKERPADAAAVQVQGSESHSGAMTMLDLVLMLAFALGLLAYQLDRKQRVLQQSSLTSASL